MATEIGQNGQPKYFCVSCNYKSSHKGHYDRHIMTSKHLNSNKSTDNGQKRTKKDKKDKKGQKGQHDYKCSCCNKIYSDRSRLWRHQKKCKTSEEKTKLVVFRNFTRFLTLCDF
jgi:hypothetical protein